MKRTYEKPALAKAGELSKVTANAAITLINGTGGNGATA